MKVILVQNIDKLGKKGEVKEVKDGFALNFLIPQKMAVFATEQALKKLKSEEQKIKAEKVKVKSETEKIISKISGKKITVFKKASDKGKLFAAVSLTDILTALRGEISIYGLENKVKLETQVKEIGESVIDLKINNKKIELTINVLKED